jgi:hypothetical protein
MHVGCFGLPCGVHLCISRGWCCALRLVCRELASNVSPDLIRDFDERWWQAAKKVNSSSSSSSSYADARIIMCA